MSAVSDKLRAFEEQWGDESDLLIPAADEIERLEREIVVLEQLVATLTRPSRLEGLAVLAKNEQIRRQRYYR